MLKSYKYFNVLLFALIIVFVLMVISAIQPVNAPGIAYFYLVVIVVIGFASLAVNLLLFNHKKHSKVLQEEIISTENVVEKNVESNLTEEMIDYKVWTENVLKKTKKENLTEFAESLLKIMSKEFEVVQGLYFTFDREAGYFKKIADYAYYSDVPPREFIVGETISGQVAKNQKVMKIIDIPDGYVTVLSGLGSSSPASLVIIPVLSDIETIGIIEMAFFKEPGEREMKFFEEIATRSGLIAGKFITQKPSE